MLLGYAELTWALGAADDAEKHYRRALHHADVSAEACADLGVLLVTRSRPAEAEPHLRRAADELGCAESLTNHANVLVELGACEEADARYREALARRPHLRRGALGPRRARDRSRGTPPRRPISGAAPSTCVPASPAAVAEHESRAWKIDPRFRSR